MLYLVPKHLPTLAQALQDLGNPHPFSIAQALGVDERTARRWLKSGDAPRPVLLSLYWLTRWGQSQLDAELHTRATLYTQLTCALREQNATLTAENLTMRMRLQASTDAKKPALGGLVTSCV